jgi:hypothetical protein
MPDPTPGRISPAIEAFVGEMLQEVSRTDANPIDSYLDMLQRSPYAGPSVEVIILMGLTYFGEYNHPDEDIQAFIRKCFEQMTGSLKWSVAEMMAVKPLGYSASEWSAREEKDDWQLDTIGILDPRKYRFKGKRGNIESVTYTGAEGDKDIPYDRIIHLTNQRWLSFGNPYGVADCLRSIRAWEAWKIVMSTLLIASKRQATPLLVGYAPSEQRVELLDANGQPLRDERTGQVMTVPAPRALLNQLIETDNNSVLATDLRNRVEAIAQSEGRSFFFDTLRLLGSLQMMGFLVAETIFTTSGSGDSNLNKGQKGTLETSVEAVVDQVQEGILEKPVRQLITWNFGNQESYGYFARPKEDETNRVQLLTAISNAVNQGTFSAADLSVINRAKELAGIESVSPSTIVEKMSTPPLDYWQRELVTNGNGR